MRSAANGQREFLWRPLGRLSVIVEDNVQIGEDVKTAGLAVEEGEELSFNISESTMISDGDIITEEESLPAVLDA